jgi:hypothetical protein
MNRPVSHWFAAKNAEAFGGIGRNGQPAFTGSCRLSIYR